MSNECLNCDCYDAEREGCTMSSVDKLYACPLETDNASLEFFLPMIPPTVTAQEHKVMVRRGKPVFYDPPAVKDAREKLLAHLAKHVPPQPYDGKPLELTVQWCFPLKGSHTDGEYRITKPDTDNLQKLLKDCMTQLHFWRDDCLVASENVVKYWSNTPGIFVKIEVIDW